MTGADSTDDRKRCLRCHSGSMAEIEAKFLDGLRGKIDSGN